MVRNDRLHAEAADSDVWTVGVAHELAGPPAIVASTPPSVHSVIIHKGRIKYTLRLLTQQRPPRAEALELYQVDGLYALAIIAVRA